MLQPRTPSKINKGDHQQHPHVPSQVPPGKKKLGKRTWLVIDMRGTSQELHAGKHAIMQRAGIPARDLRILDPLLSYPSSILGRERAIVVNLEHIKTIITAQEVFLLVDAKNPIIGPFVHDLKSRLPFNFSHQASDEGGNQSYHVKETDGRYGLNRNSPTKSWISHIPSTHNIDKPELQMHAGMLEDRSESIVERSSPLPVAYFHTGFNNNVSSSDKKGGPNALPFEFRALEACLEAACNSLDAEAGLLDQHAFIALNALTTHISSQILERVRQIKSELVLITGRVQRVRDEIEHLLDDDSDMAEMYLTDKLMRQQLEGSLTPDDLPEKEGLKLPAIDVRIHYEHSPASSSTTTAAIGKPLNVEELEMLLEAYFVLIDSILNRVSTVKEYVEDTEDYINIMLDDHQNHLLKMNVVLSISCLVINLFIVITGIFGMNISIPLFQDNNPKEFWGVVSGSSIGSLLLSFTIIGWCKYKCLI